MSRSPDPAVLFDIDGTLVDSNYLHVYAWLTAFHAVGHPVDVVRIHRCIGMGSDQLLAKLLGDDADRLGDQVRERHAGEYAKLAGLLRPFDGARELVRAVCQRGAAVVLATSAPHDELVRLRETLSIEDSVQVVTSAEDVDQAKPEPELVEVAMRKAGTEPQNTIMVGDTVWDVLAARRAGVDCVVVLTGGISAAELIEAGALAVYPDVGYLLEGLDASPLARLWNART